MSAHHSLVWVPHQQMTPKRSCGSAIVRARDGFESGGGVGSPVALVSRWCVRAARAAVTKGVRIRVIRSAARIGFVCGARSSPVLDRYHQRLGVVPGTSVMLSPK